MTSMAFAFECWADFFGEQQSEPYIRYGKVSSAASKALSGKRLCRLARKGDA